MAEFFSATNPHLYISIALTILNSALLCFTGYKFLQILQLSGYKIYGYNAWLRKTPGRYFSRIFMLSFLSFACMLVFISVVDGFEPQHYASYAGIAFYALFSGVFIKRMYTAPKKTPLKQTHRMNRLITCLVIVNLIVNFGLLCVSNVYLPHIRYIIIAITPILLSILVPLCHFIMIPLEKLINLKYLNGAKAKLGKFPTLIKIGITGSFGKTSTKYILNTILSEKYSVCISPYSFNTTMGLTKVVLDYLKPDNQILIAEMGARQVGDIKELCDLIHPQYAILTAVAPQHLDTFGSIENIKKTKNELIESLPVYGHAVFNADNAICKELAQNCKVSYSTTSLEDQNCTVHAKDIKTTSSGTEFVAVVEDEEFPCKTKLIGLHNVTNILMCIAMAKNLELTNAQIAKGISKLKPVAHRLELINSNGVKILDNSYNSSPESSVQSLKTLSLFSGRKIVVTPGLIELGNKEFEENKKFGENIAKTADIAIVVNETNKESIVQGLTEGGMNPENIFTAPTLDHAQIKLKEILQKGDVVLFENDLPDNYT